MDTRTARSRGARVSGAGDKEVSVTVSATAHANIALIKYWGKAIAALYSGNAT